MMCRCDFFLKNDPSLFFLKLFFVNKLLPLLFNKSQQLVISKYSSAASLVVESVSVFHCSQNQTAPSPTYWQL